MKLLKNIVCGSLLMASVVTVAQQDPNRTFYRYNMNLVNPAYAGSNSVAAEGSNATRYTKNSELGVNFRSQWQGVEGAPETQTAFFSTGLGKNIGLGVSIINDRTFIEEQTSITVDFSYRLKINNTTNLFLGIKAGANSYNANTGGLVTFGLSQDSSLLNIDGGFTPSIGAGALLKGEDFFIALSTPNITTTERLEQNDGEVRLGDSRVHVFLSGGYDIRLNRNVVFKPSILARYVDAAPLSLDLTAALSFNERFELGASYRVQEGISGLLLFNASESIGIGYAYETPFESPVVSSTNGTHEVFLKFKM